MQKVTLIFTNLFGLIKERKQYLLLPIFIMFALLAFLVYYIGPAAIVSLFYAGI